VGRKEIAQKELWMRKKLMIKDAYPKLTKNWKKLPIS
jgi:hypothetical protein